MQCFGSNQLELQAGSWNFSLKLVRGEGAPEIVSTHDKKWQRVDWGALVLDQTNKSLNQFVLQSYA